MHKFKIFESKFLRTEVKMQILKVYGILKKGGYLKIRSANIKILKYSL